MMYYGPYNDNLSTFTLLKPIAQIPQNVLLARVNSIEFDKHFDFVEFRFFIARAKLLAVTFIDN